MTIKIVTYNLCENQRDLREIISKILPQISLINAEFGICSSFL